MRRFILMLITTIGVCVGTIRAPRFAWRDIRENGLRAFITLRRSMLLLVLTLGPVEAQKLMRLCSAAVYELTSDQRLMRWAWNYAADATMKGIKPAQIVATVHRWARDVADEQAKLRGEGVSCG